VIPQVTSDTLRDSVSTNNIRKSFGKCECNNESTNDYALKRASLNNARDKPVSFVL